MRGLYSNIIASSYQQSVAPSIVTTNLVNYLDFSNTSCYPGTGSTVNDLVDSLTYNVVGATYLSAVNDGVFDFDGVADSIIATSNRTKVGNFTFGAWFYLNNPPINNMALISFEDSSSDCYRHLIDENAGSFYLRSKINSALLDDPTQLVNQNWYYFVSTFNDSTNLNVIYKNAVNVGSASPAILFSVAVERLCVGAITNSGSSGVTSFFKGYIGEVHIYSRDLTSAEVTQNFNATKARYGL
jgi:hypothetical protein